MIPKTRSRLGRGLSSLITISSEVPDTSSAEAQSSSQPIRLSDPIPTPAELPIGKITPNPSQPRRTFNDLQINQLAESLKTSGLIQPIIVRAVDNGYQLIAGERRLRAAKIAGFITIPAIIREVDHLTQAQMALVENIQREDLNPLDRAQAYRALLDQLGLTQAELATRLGEDRSTIANHVRLLDLAEPVRQLVRTGALSLGHAKLLAGIADVLEQEKLAHLVVNQDLSVRNLERLIHSPDKTPLNIPAKVPSAHIADLEKSLSKQLGMRIQIHRSGKNGKGRLVIHYGSLDQFDHLLLKLGVEVE